MARINGLGQTVKALREQRGLTQVELGRAVGWSRQRVGQFEDQRGAWPGPEVFNRLASALEVPVSLLLRAGGVSLEEDGGHEMLGWVISQLDDDGRDQLAEIGRAILPRHLRPPATGQS